MTMQLSSFGRKRERYSTRSWDESNKTEANLAGGRCSSFGKRRGREYIRKEEKGESTAPLTTSMNKIRIQGVLKRHGCILCGSRLLSYLFRQGGEEKRSALKKGKEASKRRSALLYSSRPYAGEREGGNRIHQKRKGKETELGPIRTPSGL